MSSEQEPRRPQREKLQRLLGGEDTAWLLQRLRAGLERHGELSGTVSKPQATQRERAAAARLIGRTVRAGNSASVSLDALDAKLRQGAWPEGLESAVVELTGPYTHPDERRGVREGWHAATARIREIAAAHPAAGDWAATVERTGALKRSTTEPFAALRLAQQLGVLAAALPADLEVIAVFAARLFGDAHALDARTPLGALGAGLAAVLGAGPVEARNEGVSDESVDPDVGVDDAGDVLVVAGGGALSRREAWASVGVLVDELSSWVLTLGLPGGEQSPTARALSVLSSAGQPAVLTYRQVVTDAVGRVPAVVYVCENPAVVAAAADRFGVNSAALICLSGQPGAAAIRLLRQLVAGGAELHYHGDFDAGGMAIARTLSRHVPWQPWHFEAADYLEAVARLPTLARFGGIARSTPWSEDLEHTLNVHRLRVEEESVLEKLLADLS